MSPNIIFVNPSFAANNLQDLIALVKLVKAGKLRAIVVTSPARMPSLPDVATVAESGFPGYEDYTWIAFFAPARTDKAIVNQLNQQNRGDHQSTRHAQAPCRARVRPGR